MTRIRIMGLCLVAAFTISAAAAVSASASEPAIYECVKQTGGKYEKKCVTGKGKGGYELKEGFGKGKKITGTSGVATLHTPAADNTEITCASSKDEAYLNSTKTEDKIKVTYAGCQLAGLKCTGGPKAKTGDIITNELKGTLGYISKSPVKVGIKIEPESGTYLAEFKCEETSVKVKGSVIGEVSPINVFTKTSEEDFNVNGSGEQEFKGFEGGSGDVLMSEITPFGFDESGQDQVSKNKGEELEIKA
jgi:hypothetical protein